MGLLVRKRKKVNKKKALSWSAFFLWKHAILLGAFHRMKVRK
ncbi:hypothetical protein BCA_4928 [Bacillus cereus 03BB102]|uniref:Uncharacterized protein n=1 Tax=Bacillus cereus (strain 03BB102) TaxID=572264 RepID=A0A158RJ63_BACC3|nr:hypothetical protein BCA_4928 [Bacillus cereus 03BB102]ACQ46115.1 hypothetical protein BAA_5064 [Bacillus anthracis str. A0248]